MKFGDKYELLESLTTGAVETFVANDKVRGERVLVHILDCAPQKPGQSTMDWVLESFRRVAPEPAGPVLETGKYSGTQYAYLVTKPDDDAAQKSWVRRYEIQGQETQETTTPRGKPLAKPLEMIAPPAPPPTPIETATPPVSVTQLLREYESQVKPLRPSEPPPPQPLPNVSLGGHPSGLRSAPAWEPVRSQNPVAPPEEPLIARPKDSFASEFRERPFPSGSTTSTFKDSSKPGEFTSFFQGPFRGESSQDLPPVSSQPSEPPQQKVGDFTAVFGSMSGRPDQAPSREDSGSIPAPASFTGMFKDFDVPQRTFNASTSAPLPPPNVAVPPVEPLSAPPKPREATPPPAYVAPPPPVLPTPPAVLPIPPTPVVSERPLVAKPTTLPGDGATGAFSHPSASTPAPVVPEEPVGPSPYTQIISRNQLMTPTSDAAEDEEAASPAAGGFPTPKAPKAPAIKPPKAPVKMPSPPKATAPKAPKAPKLDAPATPPPVSLMPLVIILMVLFFVAVLLVMYFWLRGR